MANVCRSPRVLDCPLRILHVQHSLGAGGMENGVVNVANALHKEGFDFHVVCLSHRGTFAARMPDPDKVIALDKPEGFSPKTALKLARHIRRLAPHVVHTHNLGALIYAALATGFGRTRPILHGEHGVPDDGASSARRLAQRRFFFRAASRIHTVSHALRGHLLSQGFPPDKIVALVNGVDTSRFSPGDKQSARAALALPPDGPVVVVVGRLIASKGHELLFAAFEDVVKRWGNATLLVVGGGGKDAEQIGRAARDSPIADHIRMEGFQQDPLPYYHAADLLVSPSVIEGLSNVVLEAMSAGLPALVHDACGNREVIDHLTTGCVADLSTLGNLSGQMTSWLGDLRSLAEMGRRARESVLEKFSLHTMAQSYARTYRALAGRPIVQDSNAE